ncbi:hypothetical protein Pse7367_3311 [Thalassoporum mexicanum PCC 7367]|uniref:hypothetical protein n=1 Tax=Thalassoporum mexicanum TaxID=3457544 RepID=UPI00029F879E|nr:hypothetical protein [Pseudanabaena sp. PCC 7367]AFY71551.1 hypothetical protein Pse7367_3311 [Pseudanabaena sp. PCC 7367]
MSSAPTPADQDLSQNQVTPDPTAIATYNISPLIRITLIGLYVALTTPLPFLAKVTNAPVPPWVLAVGLAIGLVGLHGALSEKVVVSDRGIAVKYPIWFPFRQGWSLAWEQIKALKPRTTGQGGMVYYFLSKDGEGYLLPMRMAGFSRFVQQVQERSGINTSDVIPLAQPWMYLILLVVTLLLLLIDAWVINTAIALGQLA